MCGIAGGYDPTGGLGLDENMLRAMLDCLSHRGPDGEGVHAEDGIWLGHTRLSIIDLTGGRQPLSNEDRSVWVSVNGEVFNYVELRGELIARGHRFRTQSDCEVICHLYEEYGPDLCQHLNGQFALALWDHKARTLLLARDRFGIAPLFYVRRGPGVVFASEIKAFLPVLGPLDLDLPGLAQTFTLWNTPAPRTIYRGIEQLCPGEVMLCTTGGIFRHRYWGLDFPPEGEHDLTDEATAASAIQEVLQDAVRLRLRADVPVGAYLSGGLDSSIISVIMQAQTSSLETFSIAFEDTTYDESVFQEQMGRRLGTLHHVRRIAASDIGRHLARVVAHTETPLLRSAPVPMYLLSELVQESGIRVVLTGEGADELFGGYDLFKEAKIRRFWARDPTSSLRPLLLNRLYPYDARQMHRTGGMLGAFYRPDLLATDHFAYAHLPTWRNGAALMSYLSDDVREVHKDCDPTAVIEAGLPDDFHRWHALNQAQYLETRLLLSGYLLSSQGERMTMAHAVEGRYPFLDHRVAATAARVAPRLHLRGLREKYILKKTFAPHLPTEITGRTKRPYGAPNREALFAGKRLLGTLEGFLSPEAISERGIFDPARVASLLEKGRRSESPLGFRDNSALLAILTTQIVCEQFCSRNARQRFLHPQCAAGDPG